MGLRQLFVCVLAALAVSHALLAGAAPAGTDADAASVVREWNEIAADAIVVTGAHAPASSGVLMAIVQVAVYDAVVAISGGYRPYAAEIWAPKTASIPAAVAQSAHDVLVDLLAAQAAALDARLASTLATVPDGPGKTAGIWAGKQAAAIIIATRSGDGRFANVPYTFGAPDPGVYQPTPPALSMSPLVPWVAKVRPFTMSDPSQFRPDPPPSLDSHRWAKAYRLTQAYGDLNSSVRTPEQSEIAIFWTEHAVRQWNRNIRAQAGRLHLDGVTTARLLASTNAAMADALIACWDAKFHYSFWRPVTAIRQGDTDGRADTIGDPDWTPFAVTPNHPEYPGAHACVSTALSHTLARFFHRDRTTFPMDAVVGGTTYVHVFSRYTDAGREAEAARIFGGMHYDFSNDAGAQIGRQVVRHMFARRFFDRTRAHGRDPDDKD
jgi:hypothetical protein